MMSQVGHLPFYLADPRCEVVRVAESRPSLIDAIGGQVGRGKVVANHRALLDDERIDAVVISAPRAATGPLTLEALEAGKHVMAEKPMAHTADQARRLSGAAAERGLTYAVGFMKRYDPGVQAAKALLDEVVADGRLGRLLLARFYDFSSNYAHPVPHHTRPAESRTARFETWPLWPDWLPEGFHGVYPWFLNAASHDVNLLRNFFPGAIEIEGAACASDGSVTALLHQDGVAMTLEVAMTAAGRWIEGAEFLFERGRIAAAIPSPMDTGAVTRVTLDDPGSGVSCHNVPAGKGWSFARQAEGFIDALAGGAPPLTNGVEGLADMELMEGIWRKIAA